MTEQLLRERMAEAVPADDLFRNAGSFERGLKPQGSEYEVVVGWIMRLFPPGLRASSRPKDGAEPVRLASFLVTPK